MMKKYAHLGVVSGMIHDTTAGRVTPSGKLGHRIDYWPNASDRRELLFGLARSAEVLLAAGAHTVVIPTDPPTIVDGPDALARLEQLVLTPGLLDVTAVHPMGSVPMGDDPQVAAVDSRGAHHHVQGLWVADASLYPTSIGIPPQLSTYAMGLHVGEALSA
jgi:choline dehydrogenase-like flavoprotein